MLLPVISNKIWSFLIDISRANTFLPLETFHDLKKEKNLPGLSNILQDNKKTNQSKSSG